YYAHHLSTIEGGMICTNDTEFYEACRMLRAHGMVREMDSSSGRHEIADDHPDLNPDFIFAHAGFNCRSTEINAVMGRSQLKRLDANIRQRTANLRTFLDHLDPEAYYTDFDTEGSSNYAFTLVLKRNDPRLAERIMRRLREEGVEFRRGLSGGGNQVRQPYLKEVVDAQAWKEFPNADHVHFNGWYIGNYPALERGRIVWLCDLLNNLASE
ncbi:MAG: DegT/DnrJ/EryC1/StrS family aminotransferase, partial [Gemmataceae bacterium]|nr:DegT/DnrJ/EryC1/StrS family aminotransferase [Gemmataceae bacterium]